MDFKFKNIKNNFFELFLVSLATLGIFGLGYFAANLVTFQKSPIIIEKLSSELYSTVKNDTIQEGRLDEQVVASINSDKYHFERCSGAKRIKEENKIYFTNATEAEVAGFVLAGNCQ